MEPSRTTHEQRSSMRDEDTGTGRQFDNPISKGSQGKWEHREGGSFAHVGLPLLRALSLASDSMVSVQLGGFLLTTLSLDNTGGQGGDTFTPQHFGQSGYDEYGTNTAGTGPGGIDTQSDRYATSGQYGGPTASYADPNRNITSGRYPEDDDDYSPGVGNVASGVGKPSITSRVKGASSPALPLGAVEPCVGAN
ncbi:hypothetical protein EDB89DRAFT_1965861 [Lactarius sanguifluus]|nr:hypothetical protein EDB89DRAFT_1965861 [Lactarius sanguifluus]